MDVVPDPEPALRFFVPGVTKVSLRGERAGILNDSQDSVDGRNVAIHHGRFP